jgi:hypothetical protein
VNHFNSKKKVEANKMNTAKNKASGNQQSENEKSKK